VLKAAFPGFITGKLSDIAGLAAFYLFAMAVVPVRRVVVGMVIAVGFAFWKSPEAGPFIAMVNGVSPLRVGRVVDAGDLFALLVLPVVWWYVREGAPVRTVTGVPDATRFRERRSWLGAGLFRAWSTRALLIIAPVLFVGSAGRHIATVHVEFIVARPVAEVWAELGSTQGMEFWLEDGTRVGRSDGIVSGAAPAVLSAPPSGHRVKFLFSCPVATPPSSLSGPVQCPVLGSIQGGPGGVLVVEITNVGPQGDQKAVLAYFSDQVVRHLGDGITRNDNATP
jgi:hypothetical protein